MTRPHVLTAVAGVAILASAAAAITLLLVPSGEAAPYATEPAFGGRVFDAPVDLVPEPGGALLLAERGGKVLRLDPAGESDPQPVLDITDRVATSHAEEGLLSVARSPAPQLHDYLWVYYTAPDPRRGVISRFDIAENGAADPGSRLDVLEVEQPYGNHNGGALRFGPDGMLYLGLGDGGDAFDPHSHGQDPRTLLGSIIRIDVSQSSPDEPYRVPAGNPHAGDDGRPEVWAHGLRNPWRMNFDSATGELWAADVGQHATEEVNLIEAGQNYGWNDTEGDVCLAMSCEDAGFRDPVHTYTHDEGCAITGGHVYRGDALPARQGQYIFGDLCTGQVYALTADGSVEELLEVEPPLVSIGQGHDGELYFLSFDVPITRLVRP